MKTRNALATLGLLCPALLLLAAASRAEAAGPRDQVKATTDRILAVLGDPALKGDEHKGPRRAKLNAVVDERFHWTEMAQRSLARHWRKRTDAEKKEYVPLFTELVRRTYMSKIEGYSGEKVQYGDERLDGSYARVAIAIITKKDTEIPVVYSMKRYGDEWRVYDIAVEGVRLVNNYRTQFNGMLNRMSFPKFIEKLKAKTAGTEDR
ncbi:ABC transporter substrate-binding protein [bacterium]|nr:ABC transporter substrate-binding protein [bacterium]